MTIRLFDHDPTMLEFNATVLECVPAAGNGFQVILDQTAFYPEGGGQPADRGRLGTVRVLDVQEGDGGILHRVDGMLTAGENVTGRIDATRRRDYMEQHSGQHLCSAVFWRELGAATTAVHLGEDLSTIDFARPDLTPEERLTLEMSIAREIAADRPFFTRRVTAAELPRDQLRRPPAREFADYRLVEIEGLDLACCCGTHVARSGQLRVVKLLAVERRRGGIRVSFLAGQRALTHYQRCWQVLETLSVQVSKPPLEVEDGFQDLLHRNELLAERVKRLDQEFRSLRADKLERLAESRRGYRLVRAILEEQTADSLSDLACQLAETPDLIILLAARDPGGEKAFLAFARGDAALTEEILDQAFRSALAAVNGRGGGRGNLRRGAGDQPQGLRDALESAGAALS